MDFSYVHIRYFIGYVYHICLQDTIQSTLSLCLLCQAMLLPMPLRPLLLTTRSGFSGRHGYNGNHNTQFDAGALDKGQSCRMCLGETSCSGQWKEEAQSMLTSPTGGCAGASSRMLRNMSQRCQG